MAEVQTWFRCGSCGAKVIYSEEEGRFFCPYCGEPYPENEETRRFVSEHRLRKNGRPVPNAAAQQAQKAPAPVAAPGATSPSARSARRPAAEDQFSLGLRRRMIVALAITLLGLILKASLVVFIGVVVNVVTAVRVRIGSRADVRWGLIGSVLQVIAAFALSSLFRLIIRGAALLALIVCLYKWMKTRHPA